MKHLELSKHRQTIFFLQLSTTTRQIFPNSLQCGFRTGFKCQWNTKSQSFQGDVQGTKIVQNPSTHCGQLILTSVYLEEEFNKWSEKPYSELEKLFFYAIKIDLLRQQNVMAKLNGKQTFVIGVESIVK